MNSADGGRYGASMSWALTHSVCSRVNGREATLQCVMNFDSDDRRQREVTAGGNGSAVAEG